MRTCIFDLETFSLYANTSILLCAVIKEVGKHTQPHVIRADQFKEWKEERSNTAPIALATLDYMMNAPGEGDDKGFDIYVAHNGQYFDKRMLNTWALKFRRDAGLRFARFIDPVLLLRRHCKLNRNSLAEAIEFFNIPHKKTPVDWSHWMKAAFDGNSKSLDYIVEHCTRDVKALESLYNITKKLVKGVDEKGSAW